MDEYRDIDQETLQDYLKEASDNLYPSLQLLDEEGGNLDNGSVSDEVGLKWQLVPVAFAQWLKKRKPNKC